MVQHSYSQGHVLMKAVNNTCSKVYLSGTRLIASDSFFSFFGHMLVILSLKQIS